MNKEIKEAFSFISPLIIFISIFMLLPLIGTFWISFWRDVSFLPKKFLGIDNYLRLFKDPQFLQSLYFTTLFTVFSVAIEMVLGIIFALVINEKKGIIRGIILLPWVIPSVISARIWQLIYRYDYGLANFLLEKIFHFSINWLGSPSGAFFSLLLADVWRTAPFVTIIILAGLQAIPEDLYKQAKIDGTNFFQRFFKITIPLLKPIIIVALLFRTIDALRIFDIIYVITGGGPAGTTTSLSIYAYKYFLLGDFSYGATISVILFFIAFFIAIFYIKIGKFKAIL